MFTLSEDFQIKENLIITESSTNLLNWRYVKMAGITDLAKDVATRFSVPQTQGKAIVQYVFETVQSYLAQGEDVAIRGFGVFKTKPMNARTIKNPRTGEQVDIPPSTRVLFTVGSDLKESVKVGSSGSNNQ